MIPMQMMMHNELHVFAYSQEMDRLMLANSVVDNEEEEPRSPTFLEEGMIIEINDKEETTPINKECEGGEMMDTNEEEQTMPWPTPRSKVGSNDVNTTPPEMSSM
jgi:hypothetical protein